MRSTSCLIGIACTEADSCRVLVVVRGWLPKRRRQVMRARVIAILVAATSVVGASQAYAQESNAAGPGPVVVTIIPGGATFFTEGKDTNGPSFGNYGLGGAVAVNFNRFIGVEGEVAGALGVTQDLDFSNATSTLKTPN